MKRTLLIFALFFHMEISANAENIKLQDVTIVVSSYDKYANLWPTFFELLFKNWPSLNTYNKDVPIILVSNTKSFNSPRVTTILSPYSRGWSGNINDALKKIKTKYVLYLQDDYFINDIVLEDKIHEILYAVTLYKLDYAETSPRCAIGSEHVGNSPFLLYKDHSTGCFTTLQAAIWNTKTFEEFTNTNFLNIWDFENKKIEPHHRFAFYAAKTKPLKYENFMYHDHIDLRPYAWLYYKGYDLSFVADYKIHPKYKIFNKQVEWYRQSTPTLANTGFYIGGFLLDTGRKVKKIIRKFQDKSYEKNYSDKDHLDLG